MKAVLQRVTRASVTVEGDRVSEIGDGLLILLGIGPEDTEEKARMMTKKIAALRIFSDEAGKMNLSVRDVGGSAIVVSQFTLFADCRKGNRPAFVGAAAPSLAAPLVDRRLRRPYGCGAAQQRPSHDHPRILGGIRIRRIKKRSPSEPDRERFFMIPDELIAVSGKGNDLMTFRLRTIRKRSLRSRGEK